MYGNVQKCFKSTELWVTTMLLWKDQTFEMSVADGSYIFFWKIVGGNIIIFVHVRPENHSPEFQKIIIVCNLSNTELSIGVDPNSIKQNEAISSK